MLASICVLLNVLIIGYFIANKWKLVAWLYSGAMLVFALLSLFSSQNPAIVSFLTSIFGEQGYDDVLYMVQLYCDGVMLPYFGVLVLTFILALIITLKTTEKIVVYFGKQLSFRSISNERISFRRFDRKNFPTETRKLYLVNCLILC